MGAFCFEENPMHKINGNNITLTRGDTLIANIELTRNGDEVAVRVRSRGSNYYGYVGTLTIIEQ